MKPIGLLGGTFDPVHYGHLRLAIEMLERIDLAEVRFIPLHIPPHRNGLVTTSDHRLNMLQIATNDLSGINIDDYELNKPTTSYTIETVSMFRKQIGDTPVCLLMGDDAFQSISTWHRWNELLDYVHIIVANRPANKTDDSKKSDEKNTFKITASVAELHKKPSGLVYMANFPMLDISATRIRTILKSGKQPEGLLPVDVIKYINTHKLYQI